MSVLSANEKASLTRGKLSQIGGISFRDQIGFDPAPPLGGSRTGLVSRPPPIPGLPPTLPTPGLPTGGVSVDTNFFQSQNVTSLAGANAVCSLLPPAAQPACNAAAAVIFGSTVGGGPLVPEDCPQGRVKIGGKCVDLSAAAPGGVPLTTDVGEFTAVSGGFGIAGFIPLAEERIVMSCPRGFVLGIDNICYSKAQLPKRSKFRKWKGEIAPPISRRDVRAINRAAGAKERVLELAKKAGLHASLTKPKTGGGKKKSDHELIEKLILATRG